MCTDIYNFLAGVYGGAAGVLAGHPLDTIKVRLQTQSDLYRGPWHCFTSIIQKENVKGLYKGMSSPLASLAFMNAIIFGVHGYIVRTMENTTSVYTHFIAGCAAGSAQALLASPTELLKLRIQIQTDNKNAKYKSPYHCLRLIIKDEGYKKLTRGMISTQLRDCPAFGIYFASYEYLARNLSKDGTMEALTSCQLLLAGGAAGMLSWLFNYPTDVIKTRFQASNEYKTYLDCIKKTYNENGFKTFYKGLGTTLLRAFPSNAATFFVVEWTYRIFIDMKFLDNALNMDHSHGRTTVDCKDKKRYTSVYDLWNRNCFLLPEAGSTYIDPMIHGCRFL